MEPILHTDSVDVLPESHPWCELDVYCAKCNEMLHAGNNECMQSWVEYRGVALCARCAQPFLCELRNFWCFHDDEGILLSMKGKIQ
jgi:hypothetical protein